MKICMRWILVLRNNITTDECPWGVHTIRQQTFTISKRKILALIEVMGLAVLPARLKNGASRQYILENRISASNPGD